MSLSISTLENALKVSGAYLMAHSTATRSDAAFMMCTDYTNYAKSAQHCGSIFVSTYSDTALYDKLLECYQISEGSAPEAASLWGDGLIAFWYGAHFGGTGYVTSPGNRSYVVSALTDLFSSYFDTSDVAAYQLAHILDTFTRTVVAVDTVLPTIGGCTSPIY